MNYLLGIKITRKEYGWHLSQQGYAESILEKYLPRFNSKHTHDTPLPTTDPSLPDDDEPCSPDKPYREIVGALMYLMTGTRPDLAYSVSVVASKMDRPTMKDWRRLIRILRYLKRTVDYGLTYRTPTDLQLSIPEPPSSDTAHHVHGYTDSDWANDPQTAQITYRLCLLLRKSPGTERVLLELVQQA